MSCNHLVPATNIRAFYSSATKVLTVEADVTFGPGNFGIDICRGRINSSNMTPIAMVVATPARGKISPEYLVSKKTISESFPFDYAPRTILVYTTGPNGPTKTEVTVGDAPVRLTQAATNVSAPAPKEAAGGRRGSITSIATRRSWPR